MQVCARKQHCHDPLAAAVYLLRMCLQVLASFQEQLLGQNSEKDQRSLIKQLLAEAGGEQARTVLSAISKVPVANVPEPKAKQQAQRSEADEVRWDWSEAGIAL
jgi:hypothetical protein